MQVQLLELFGFLICSLLFAKVVISYRVVEQDSPSQRLPLAVSQPLRTGDLLRSLDLITADSEEVNHLSTESVHRKWQQPQDGTSKHNTTPMESISRADHNEYDYEKAYDQFVRKYFAKGREEALEDGDSNDEDDELAESFNGDEDHDLEPLSSSVTDNVSVKPEKRNKRQKSPLKKSKDQCKQVYKSDRAESCIVCENPRTNAKSESCSYSLESKPENYAYRRERNFKKHHDDDENDKEQDEDIEKDPKYEDDKHKILDQRSKSARPSPRRKISKLTDKPTKPQDWSNCRKKYENDSICYLCDNSGENLMECVSMDSGQPKRRKGVREKHVQKKLVKRMVSYTTY